MFGYILVNIKIRLQYLSYWDVGQPDGRNSNEDCIHMNGHIWGTSSGRWNDRNCQDRMPFVCEFPAIYSKVYSYPNETFSTNLSEAKKGFSMYSIVLYSILPN